MKNIKLYNMIFPIYIWLYLFPGTVLISLAGNYLIDSLVVIILSKIMFKKYDKNLYHNCIWRVWALGYASDVIGCLYLFGMSNIGYDYLLEETQDSVLYQIMEGINNVTNHPDMLNAYSMWFIASAVLISAIAIFLFDYFIAFRKTDLTKKQKLIMSLSLAIFTAPYTFFLPTP